MAWFKKTASRSRPPRTRRAACPKGSVPSYTSCRSVFFVFHYCIRQIPIPYYLPDKLIASWPGSSAPASRSPAAKDKSSRVPEGLWVKCPGCAQVIYNKDLATNLNVCPKCGHHFRIGAAERLRMLFDDGVWTEYDKDLVSTDPLEFTDTKPYRTRLEASIEATGLKDAVIAASGRIDGIETSSQRWSTASSAAAWAWWSARRSRAPSSAPSTSAGPSSSSAVRAARG